MRLVTGLILAAVSSAASATSCLRFIPEALVNANSAQIEEGLLREDFAQSTVVLEGTVVSVKSTSGYAIATVQVDRYWKSDGKPVKSIYLPAGPCRPEAQMHMRYVFLARRAQGLPAHLRLDGEPLSLVSSLAASKMTANTRSFLSSLSVIPVRVLK